MNGMVIEFGKIKPLPNASLDKSFALKPLEEVAEVYSAWERYTACGPELEPEVAHELLEQLSYEIGDVIQTMANLAAGVAMEHVRISEWGDGYVNRPIRKIVSWEDVMDKVYQSNVARGRYDVGDD